MEEQRVDVALRDISSVGPHPPAVARGAARPPATRSLGGFAAANIHDGESHLYRATLQRDGVVDTLPHHVLRRAEAPPALADQPRPALRPVVHAARVVVPDLRRGAQPVHCRQQDGARRLLDRDLERRVEPVPRLVARQHVVEAVGRDGDDGGGPPTERRVGVGVQVAAPAVEDVRDVRGEEVAVDRPRARRPAVAIPPAAAARRARLPSRGGEVLALDDREILPEVRRDRRRRAGRCVVRLQWRRARLGGVGRQGQHHGGALEEREILQRCRHGGRRATLVDLGCIMVCPVRALWKVHAARTLPKVQYRCRHEIVAHHVLVNYSSVFDRRRRRALRIGHHCQALAARLQGARVRMSRAREAPRCTAAVPLARG